MDFVLYGTQLFIGNFHIVRGFISTVSVGFHVGVLLLHEKLT